MATKKRNREIVPDPPNMPEQDLLAFTKVAMRVYGEHVNLDRAVPDFRDGLKPVTRRLIHAAASLARDREIKTARLVGECFAASSAVLMADNTEKLIENVRVGDLVKTPLGPRPVVREFVIKERKLLCVQLTSGQRINATPDQVFYAYPGKFSTVYKDKDTPVERKASNLTAGIRIVTIDGTSVVDSVTTIPGLHTVYDIEVVEAHRFYVHGVLVHNCMGKFHPHGDASIVGAVNTLVDNPVNEFTGIGNWGSLVAPPAAMRYTEVKTSPYGRTFMLSNYYNSVVTDFVPNYDRSDKEPLLMPATLPNLLFNGSSGIGVGITTSLPAFTPTSLLSVMVSILRKEKLGWPELVKRLEFISQHGAEPLRNKANRAAMLAFVESPEATFQWTCPVEVDEAAKCITLKSFIKGVKIETLLAKIKGLKIRGVDVIQTVGSTVGTFGYEVFVKKTVNSNEVQAIADRIQRMMTVNVRYSCYVTERLPDSSTPEGYKVDFYQMSLGELIVRWLKWRIELEKRSLEYQISLVEKSIAFTKLMLFVFDNLDAILKIIRYGENPLQELMTKFKITEDEANAILERKLRSLSKLDKQKLLDQLDDLKKKLADLQRRLKDPRSEVADFLEMASTHLKLGTNPRGFAQWGWAARAKSA